MAIRTVLIDDNQANIERLETMIDEIYDVDITARYNDPRDFLKNIKHLKFDLCIIDYHLPNMSGIDCIQRIPSKNIILTSHQPIPAHEALNFDDIMDVILLDEQFELKRLEKSIKRVRDQITAERGYVVFKTYPNNYRQIQVDDIIYIDTDKPSSKHKIIHTYSEPIKTGVYTLEDIMEKLPDELFLQINETQAIHANTFHSFSVDGFINISTPWKNCKLKEMKLSKTYKQAFYAQLNIK